MPNKEDCERMPKDPYADFAQSAAIFRRNAQRDEVLVLLKQAVTLLKTINSKLDAIGGPFVPLIKRGPSVLIAAYQVWRSHNGSKRTF